MNSFTPKRRVQLHDVPEDRPAADLEHGFGPGARLLGDARALAAGEDHALHERAPQGPGTARSAPRKISPCSPPPHAPDTSPRSTPALRRCRAAGRQPSVRSASAEDRVSARASAGWSERSRSQPGLPPKRALNRIHDLPHRAKGCRIRSEIDSARRAVRAHAPAPAPARDSPPRARARAARGAPRRDSAGSPACPTSSARTQSGISRSADQSPPPMTLPARAVASGGPSCEKAVAKAPGQQSRRRPCCCCRDRDRRAGRPPRTAGRRRRSRRPCRWSRPRRTRDARSSRQACEQRAGAEHVGGEGAERIAVGFAHQRLRREVKHDLRVGARAPRRAARSASRTSPMIERRAVRRTIVPQIRRARRRERIAGDLRAHAAAATATAMPP